MSRFEIATREGATSTIRYCISHVQGVRNTMEDYASVRINIPEQHNCSFFGVFDGHGGNRVSEKCSQILLDELIKDIDFSKICDSSNLQNIRTKIEDVFIKIDKTLLPENHEEEIEDAGSTAVCVVITDKYIITCNCGDSRSIILSKENVEHQTVDHKVSNTIENDCLKRNKSCVVIHQYMYAQSDTGLAVTRSIGDYKFKRGDVIDDYVCSIFPDVTFNQRNSTGRFVILGSDGLWDVLTNDDVRKLINYYYITTDGDLTRISKILVKTALYKGSHDNITLIIIDLVGSDKNVTSRDYKLEEENEIKIIKEHDITINHAIETVIDSLLSENKKISVGYITRTPRLGPSTTFSYILHQ